jgi:hypothetical protein
MRPGELVGGCSGALEAPLKQRGTNCATLDAHLVLLTRAAIFIEKLEGPVAQQRVQCTQQPVLNALNAPA